MANQANTCDTESIWRPNAWILGLASLLAWGLLLTTAFTDIIVTAYRAKTLVACCCLAFLGFLFGFGPHSESRTVRRMHYRNSMVFGCAALLQATVGLTGWNELPASQRGYPLFDPHFLASYGLLVAVMVLSQYICTVLFRRLHPDEAIIPLTPQDREQLAQPSPEARRTLLKSMLIVPIVFIPAFVSIFLFPKHHVQIMLATMLLSVSGLSAFTGWRWNVSDASGRRFAVVMGLIGPVAMFVGSLSAGKAYDLLHVLRAMKFAATMAAALWLPALAIRLARRRRSSTS